MKKGIVGHDGVVSEITPSGYKVSIVSRSACAACHAKGLDKVTVNMEESMGMKAAWLVYAIPAVILVTFLLYLQYSGASELATGLSVLGAIAVYFFVLYLFRKRIGRHFSFSIAPGEEDN